MVKKFMLISLLIVSFMVILIGCSDSSKTQKYTEDSEYVLEITNGERFFKSEVVPKSDAEKFILDYFKIEINDDYDNLKNVFIDSDAFNYYSDAYKEKFNDGLYTEEVTVHSLNGLNEGEYSSESNGIKYYYYIDRLKKYNPNEFQIIEVNYTNKLTEKYNAIAQWGSGDWIRYFVVVKKDNNSGWRIFDVYGHM